MRTVRVRLAIFTAVLGAATPALAQLEGRGADGAQTPGVLPELVSTCVDSQRQTLAVMDAANSRLEGARQTNSASEIRAAMADLQRVLLEARTALGRCTELQKARAAAPAQSSMANMPGHDMSKMQPSTPASAAAAPKASPANAQAAPTMAMVQTAFDPAKLSCSPKVGPKTAARTTYQGRTYFFCSTKERDEFLKDPAMSLSMMPPQR